MSRKKVLLYGFVLLALVSAVLVWAPWRPDAATRRALAIKEQLSSNGISVAVGRTERDDSGARVWHDVALALPAFPAPMPLTAQTVRFKPDGALSAANVRIAPPENGEGVTLRFAELALGAAEKNAAGEWIRGSFAVNGVDLSEERRVQLLLIPLQALLFTSPRAVQELPNQLIKALRSGSLSGSYVYNPVAQTLVMQYKLGLPDFFSIDVYSSLKNVTQAAFSRCYKAVLQGLDSPQGQQSAQTPAQCREAFAPSQPLALSLKLQEEGMRAKALQLYAVVTRQKEAEAEAVLTQLINSKPVPAPSGVMPDAQDVHVAETVRRALLALVSGESKAVELTFISKEGVTLQDVLESLEKAQGYGAALSVTNSESK